MMPDWRATAVAADCTHHTLDGAPLYAARFDEVLKFHAPGLAPARDASGAFHIDIHGAPAFAERYLRTFGFYEGLAAAVTAEGWTHIHPDGSPASRSRWSWAGNMQGGQCPARGQDGRYTHIDGAGRPLTGWWRYAGDYRDGIAVVQREDGASSHIDMQGALIHGCWFLDLDVFHKGFARARDGLGWTHIDRAGQPIYRRRFAAVEPFYNGQARVEREDGALEVVDEAGTTLVELRSPLRSEFAALSADLVGFWRTDTIACAVGLGVFEALPGTTPDLSVRFGLPPVHTEALLRALAELSLVTPVSGSWRATPRGQLLRADHPLTLADAAAEYAGPLRALWHRLPDALRSPGWRPDVFGSVADDPARIIPHHRMLRSYARHDYPAVPAALNLRGDERLLDVGGGVGALAGLLLEAHPNLEILLLDRPEVIAQAPQRTGLIPVARDIFGAWNLKADAAILARVLHDWPDPDAIRILLNVRSALPSGGRVFLVEMPLPEDNPGGGLCDLHLRVVTGGRERSASEYAALLMEAGFEPVGVRALPALPVVIEGVAR